MPAAPRAASAWPSDLPRRHPPVIQRLRSRQQFQAVLAGAPVAKTPPFALHRLALEAPVAGERLFPSAGPWLGVLLPKRWARRAVTRNAIRRQIYETARPRGAALPDAAHVVRLRAAFAREQFVSATSDALKRCVRSELEQLWARAGVPLPDGKAPHVA